MSQVLRTESLPIDSKYRCKSIFVDKQGLVTVSVDTDEPNPTVTITYTDLEQPQEQDRCQPNLSNV
ncbi:hypothetical protein ES703_74014 [subsurface metagenome]